MDLISCRNLLIYLEADLQRKVLAALHYALKPEGFLFLGESESTSSFAELFEVVEKKHKIFSKKPGLTPHLYSVPHHPAEKKETASPKPLATPEEFPAQITPHREADRVTVNRYAPPGVLIDAKLQVLQFRGDTSAFLRLPTGNASHHLLRIARERLDAAAARRRQKGQGGEQSRPQGGGASRAEWRDAGDNL